MEKTNNKQRLFEVMSKVDKTFKYNVNEVSTGLAQRAFDNTMRDKWSGNDSDIMRHKAGYQADKFRQYINPELKKYVMGKFANVEGFEIYTHNGVEVVLKFPILNKPHIESVKVVVAPENSKVIKTVIDKKNHGRPEDLEGGSELLSPNHISILPTVIKRIQADMRGEKSQYNPEKPAPAPEPIQEPTPVQSTPIQKTGFIDRLKNKFKE
jgi:hypothetical protein